MPKGLTNKKVYKNKKKVFTKINNILDHLSRHYQWHVSTIFFYMHILLTPNRISSEEQKTYIYFPILWKGGKYFHSNQVKDWQRLDFIPFEGDLWCHCWKINVYSIILVLYCYPQFDRILTIPTYSNGLDYLYFKNKMKIEI